MATWDKWTQVKWWWWWCSSYGMSNYIKHHHTSTHIHTIGTLDAFFVYRFWFLSSLIKNLVPIATDGEESKVFAIFIIHTTQQFIYIYILHCVRVNCACQLACHFQWQLQSLWVFLWWWLVTGTENKIGWLINSGLSGIVYIATIAIVPPSAATKWNEMLHWV